MSAKGTVTRTSELDTNSDPIPEARGIYACVGTWMGHRSMNTDRSWLGLTYPVVLALLSACGGSSGDVFTKGGQGGEAGAVESGGGGEAGVEDSASGNGAIDSGGAGSGGKMGGVNGGSSGAAAAGASTGGAGSGGAGSGGAGAGGGSASLECNPFVACGGKLLGTWTARRECASSKTLADTAASLTLCDGAQVSALKIVIRGTLAFDPVSVLQDLTQVVTATEIVPSSCLSAEQDCDLLATDLSTNGAAFAQCVVKGDACACQLRYEFHDTLAKSYLQSGSTFTWDDPDTGTPASFDYCVAGDVLRIRGADIDVFSR